MIKKESTEGELRAALKEFGESPSLEPLLDYFRAQRSAVQSLLGDAKILDHPSLVQSLCGELKAYNDILDMVANSVDYTFFEDEEVVSKIFKKKVLTKKAKAINKSLSPVRA